MERRCRRNGVRRTRMKRFADVAMCVRNQQVPRERKVLSRILTHARARHTYKIRQRERERENEMYRAHCTDGPGNKLRRVHHLAASNGPPPPVTDRHRQACCPRLIATPLARLKTKTGTPSSIHPLPHHVMYIRTRIRSTETRLGGMRPRERSAAAVFHLCKIQLPSL